jgi:hypothetical protein
MRQGLIEDVSKVVQTELIASMEKFPLFNSAHEGYAVIKEEVEEAKEDMVKVESDIDCLWVDIKFNQPIESVLEQLQTLGDYALVLACEAIQVAAMCVKFEQSAEKWREADARRD